MVELNTLLEQTVEEASVVRAAVEVELARADPAVVCPEEPALEKRSDAMDARHGDVSRIAAGRDVGRMAEEARRREALVAAPVVGLDLLPTHLRDD
jgi:hypothetical protein